MEQSQCPPPRRFQAAVGVRQARFTSQPPFIRRGRSRGRFAVGVRYERDVQELLGLHALGQVELEHVSGPWIEFIDRNGKPRWCQPDALLINKTARTCLIAEVKYQHTADAWWQLKHLYGPVLEKIYPAHRLGFVEIVHWFDPLTPWPEAVLRVPSLSLVPYDNRVSILISNPKRGSKL